MKHGDIDQRQLTIKKAGEILAFYLGGDGKEWRKFLKLDAYSGHPIIPSKIFNDITIDESDLFAFIRDARVEMDHSSEIVNEYALEKEIRESFAEPDFDFSKDMKLSVRLDPGLNRFGLTRRLSPQHARELAQELTDAADFCESVSEDERAEYIAMDRAGGDWPWRKRTAEFKGLLNSMHISRGSINTKPNMF